MDLRLGMLGVSVMFLTSCAETPIVCQDTEMLIGKECVEVYPLMPPIEKEKPKAPEKAKPIKKKK